MAQADFSESSYAFLATHEIMNGAFGVVTSSPEFPTLRQEGSTAGGYDVRIPLNPVPLFLQFKVPDVIRKNTHLRPPEFPIPYYRFYLRTKRPNQHALLLGLESKNDLVFYTSPRFHEATSLDNYYRSNGIIQNSLFIRPSDIGKMDDKRHHISYCRFPVAWCHSQPKEIKKRFSTQRTLDEIKKKVIHAPISNADSFLQELSYRVTDAINKQLHQQKDGFTTYEQNGISVKYVSTIPLLTWIIGRRVILPGEPIPSSP
jgi:hypothetical protein